MADPYAERSVAEAMDRPSASASVSVPAGSIGGHLVTTPADLAGPDAERAEFIVLPRHDEGLLPPLARLPEPLAAALLAGDSGEPGLRGLQRLEALGKPLLLVKHGLIAGPSGSEGCAAISGELLAAGLRAAAADGLEWERDPDFGWELPLAVPEADDDGRLLCPRLIYASADRVYEHAELVAATKRRWHERLPADAPPQLEAAIGWPPVPTGTAWKE